MQTYQVLYPPTGPMSRTEWAEQSRRGVFWTQVYRRGHGTCLRPPLLGPVWLLPIAHPLTIEAYLTELRLLVRNTTRRLFVARRREYIRVAHCGSAVISFSPLVIIVEIGLMEKVKLEIKDRGGKSKEKLKLLKGHSRQAGFLVERPIRRTAPVKGEEPHAR